MHALYDSDVFHPEAWMKDAKTEKVYVKAKRATIMNSADFHIPTLRFDKDEIFEALISKPYRRNAFYPARIYLNNRNYDGWLNVSEFEFGVKPAVSVQTVSRAKIEETDTAREDSKPRRSSQVKTKA